MNDAERLVALREKLDKLKGLDEDTFAHISTALERKRRRFGYDAQGRLKVAVFDARSYDTESFDRSNRERFAMRYISASLDSDTAVAAKGHKAVCIFCKRLLRREGCRNAGGPGCGARGLALRWFQ